MSGTSYDSIDVCSISVGRKIKLLNFSSFNYPPKLKKEIASVIEKQALSLKGYGELNIKIGKAFGRAINAFIKKNNIVFFKYYFWIILKKIIYFRKFKFRFIYKISIKINSSIIVIEIV